MKITKGKRNIFRAISFCMVELQLFKVKELDVCGSLVLSNPVTFVSPTTGEVLEQSTLHHLA